MQLKGAVYCIPFVAAIREENPAMLFLSKQRSRCHSTKRGKHCVQSDLNFRRQLDIEVSNESRFLGPQVLGLFTGSQWSE
jgi:hypothetical protein